MNNTLITIGKCATCSRNMICTAARDCVKDCKDHTESTELCTHCVHNHYCDIKTTLGSPIIICPDLEFTTTFTPIPF